MVWWLNLDKVGEVRGDCSPGGKSVDRSMGWEKSVAAFLIKCSLLPRSINHGIGTKHK